MLLWRQGENKQHNAADNTVKYKYRSDFINQENSYVSCTLHLFLASERDTLRGNTIENRGYLFVGERA